MRLLIPGHNIVASFADLLEANSFETGPQDHYDRAIYSVLADIEYLFEHENLMVLEWTLNTLLRYIEQRFL